MRLTGSGATFPFPLYSAWFKAFSTKNKNITVDYQGKGSGAGIRDFINHTVDFAASDAAMTDEEISKVPGGVQLLPMTGGEIVLGYNLPGNPKLKLPRDVYAGIFLGKITKWSDPKLKAANPGVTLPDLDITVVRRADASGTTFVFTTHLSTIDEEWKRGPGVGTTVNWPKSDKFVASPKNDGVSATIKQTPGAIGYVELIYALSNNLPYAAIKNAAGTYVEPSLQSVTAAAAAAKLKPDTDFRVSITNAPGADAYPIASFTWLLVHKDSKDAAKAKIIKDFLTWMISPEAQQMASELKYSPLPKEVVTLVQARLPTLKAGGKTIASR
jgi:phosphate transport system substrate-binding protein